MKTLPLLFATAALILSTGAAFAAPHGPPPGGMPPPMGGMPPPPPGPPPAGFGYQPHVGFSFNFGGDPVYQNDCVGYGEAISNVADEGFTRIRLIDRTRRELIFQARRNFRSYEVDVDRCSGDINDVSRLR